jgi:hypothetical protein
VAALAGAEQALVRAQELIDETSARAYQPEVHECRAHLARLRGDTPAAQEVLQRASPLGAPQPTLRAAQPDPRAYTPEHLADNILQSKSALEGERKQDTVLFADVQGSMELAETEADAVDRRLRRGGIAQRPMRRSYDCLI